MPAECTDRDLDWVNEQLRAVGLPDSHRTVDITPDPRLSTEVTC